MTKTADRTDAVAGPLAVDPVPRRPLRSRIALGHLVMVLAGILAFLLVLAVLRNRAETVEIAVTDVAIEAGAGLERSAIRYATIGDADADLLNGFLTPDEVDQALVEGWVAVRTVAVGVPLRPSDFRREDAASGLRAMSVPVGTTHAVNGAIVPGDRIDIIVVDRGTAGYVATDVEVIGVGAAPTSASGGFALTVAVDDATSLRLALAISDGAIQVVRATGAAPASPGAVYPEPPGGEVTGGG